MKNIYLIPSKDYKVDYTLLSGEVIEVVRLGQLILNIETGDISINKNSTWAASCDTDVLVPHHIYITSGEEIKEGEWCHDIRPNEEGVLVDIIYKKRKGLQFLDSSTEVKIILTTDPTLIADGVQSIDDEFLEWLCKNPTCDFVKVTKLDYLSDNQYRMYDLPQEETKGEVRYSPGNYYHRACAYCKIGFTGGKRCTLCQECTLKSDRIEFDMDVKQTVEESKQETLEEAAENYAKRSFDSSWKDVDDHFIAGTKWQAKRMYSEEEVLEMLYQLKLEIQTDNDFTFMKVDDWFEQNKK